jgi:hypothetical protein
MLSFIMSYHKDEENDLVAQPVCGHCRTSKPYLSWVARYLVITVDG